MQRRAFTLIELLVVMAIMLTLFALGVAFLPGTYQDRHVQRGAEQIQRYLVMAREKAKRDQVPVGVQLLKSMEPGKESFVEKLRFVTRPADITRNSISSLGPDTVSVDSPAAGTILDGDYLEVNGNGLPHRIASKGPPLKLASPLPYPLNGCTQFRIVRQPVPMPGELELTLARNIAIDTSLCSTSGVQEDPGNFSKHPTDIIFSPTGNLIGDLANNGDMVILYVRDVSLQDPAAGSPLLVVVYKRTGFIATHIVNNDKNINNDGKATKYFYTNQARSSGL